jgi:hypothetical protein
MHSSNTRGNNHQNFRRNTLRCRAQLHNSCARVCEGGGHLKDILSKKRNSVKTIVGSVINYNVLKLLLITFSKMLFVFIIISLFLLDPVVKPVILFVFFI